MRLNIISSTFLTLKSYNICNIEFFCNVLLTLTVHGSQCCLSNKAWRHQDWVTWTAKHWRAIWLGRERERTADTTVNLPSWEHGREATLMMIKGRWWSTANSCFLVKIRVRGYSRLSPTDRLPSFPWLSWKARYNRLAS